MPKICQAEGCTYNVFGGGYCQRHQRLRTDKKPKALRQFTPKRQKVNLVYDRKARDFREANPFCRINSPVCTRATQGVHHKKGKSTIELLLDKNFWMPACNACNLWVEENHKEAVKLGFKLSRHHE